MEKYEKVGAILKLVEDENVVSLKDYKEAKIHLENLNHIKKVLDLTVRGLVNFKVYTPAYESIYYLEGQLIMVNAYIKRYNKVLKKEKK